MFERITKIGLGVFVPIILMGTGCPQQGMESPTAATDGEPTSLNDDGFGGYNTEDEATAFGLDVMNQFASDEAIDDPTIDEAEIDEMSASGDYDAYWIRLVWGNLKLNTHRGDDYDGPVIDWTGSLTLDGEGALILRRLIRFDPHDSIIDEDDRKLVLWESFTGPHIDGLLIKVLVPTDLTDAELTLLAGPFEATITFAELDQYNEITMIDDDGNGMAIVGLKAEDDACHEGFMQGKYHSRTDHPGGIFRGRTVNEAGVLNGYLRGHYGINDLGDQVFFGKYISETGHFKGRMRGTYGAGAFSGIWANLAGTTEGHLNGKYVTGTGTNTGFFQGLWQEACVE